MRQRGNTLVIYGIIAIAILALIAGLLAGVKGYLTRIEEHAYVAGKKDERAKWLARESKELAAANEEIDRLHKQAREEEGHHAEMLFAISKDYEREIGNAKRARDLALDAVRSGAVVLRDPGIRTSGCEGPRLGPAREAPAAAGKRNGAAAADLSREAGVFLLELASEADDVVRQLTACQAVVRSDREGVVQRR